MDALTTGIFTIFLTYGYLAVFAGVMLDNAGFPLPGELILLVAGSLVAGGQMDFGFAVAAAAVGALLSDFLWYLAGRRGSRRIMQIYCRFSFGSVACMTKTENYLSRFGSRSLVYARFIPGYRTFAAPMAGMSGVSQRQFLLFDGLGALLWATIGIAIGTLFSERMIAIIGLLENSKVVLIYFAISLFLLYILTKWLVRRRHGAAQLPVSVQFGKKYAESVSIIIPVLNEADNIAKALLALHVDRELGHEVIVVDGGSTDDTVTQAEMLADEVISILPGRARQMNAGASKATGDLLLFLHADTQLPDKAIPRLLVNLRKTEKVWGRFDVRLSGQHPMLRLIAYMMNWRSRITGIATGDQAIFVRREAFESLGGFPEIPLMEDIAFSSAMQSGFGSPLCLRDKVITSSRRWEKNGIFRTILLMWKLRLAYFLGVPPEQLAQQYTNNKLTYDKD
ncbi:MAG: TIGR04283 family arsenosugar biosynthesis glycosyltransferase [Methylophilaceae bacterium]|nr:TIGR04283 family arsenosugar biosynthesis glycosyltransferase [Methylophilaceae bacterium]